MYLRDDGRTRHGRLVTPDEPAAGPPAAAPSPAAVTAFTSSTAAVQSSVTSDALQFSAPGGVTNETLPIAPLHLWREFSGPLIHTPVDTSGTLFPWPPGSERRPSSWRQFTSSATSETRMGHANGEGGQERDGDDDDKDEEMRDEDEGDDANGDKGCVANAHNASKN